MAIRLGNAIYWLCVIFACVCIYASVWNINEAYHEMPTMAEWHTDKAIITGTLAVIFWLSGKAIRYVLANKF